MRRTSWAPVLLAPRIPASVIGGGAALRLGGGPTISGGTVGATVIPQIAGAGCGDALRRDGAGLGARPSDNLDGTLRQQVDFPPRR